jgi:hypothetical protein
MHEHDRGLTTATSFVSVVQSAGCPHLNVSPIPPRSRLIVPRLAIVTVSCLLVTGCSNHTRAQLHFRPICCQSCQRRKNPLRLIRLSSGIRRNPNIEQLHGKSAYWTNKPLKEILQVKNLPCSTIPLSFRLLLGLRSLRGNG